MSRPPRSLTVFSHARPDQTGDALRRVIQMARDAGVEVNVPPAEVDKHGIEAAKESMSPEANPSSCLPAEKFDSLVDFLASLQ